MHGDHHQAPDGHAPPAVTQPPDARFTSTTWSTERERGSVALLSAFAWVALHCGRRAARLLLWPTTAYFFLFGGTARRASKAWLNRVLPRPVTWRDGLRHVFAFASVTLDRVYFLNAHFDRFDLRVYGAEHCIGHSRATPGIFMLGAHVGSFEATRAIAHQQPGLEVALLMYEENAKMIGRVLQAINPQAAQEIIALGRLDSMLHLRDRLDQGVVVGMLADRTLADDDVLIVNFFGAPVRLPAGPFRLAAILRRPILLMLGLYCGGNRYDVHFEPIHDFSAPAQARIPRAQGVQQAAEQYAARLEHFCRLHPYNWFNFYDFWQQGQSPQTPTP